MAEPEIVELAEREREVYREGSVYNQTASEIHWSQPNDGTVTIVERTFKDDVDHAYVYWRGKGGWVDAKPRPATEDEIRSVTRRALTTWF